MTSQDPRLARYGDLTVRGATRDELASAIEGHLEAPWSRATEIEQSWHERGAIRDQPIVYRRHRDDALPGALLYLFAGEDGSLYVSNVVPTDTSQLTVAEYNSLLHEFYGAAVEAAASQLSARAELDLADYDLAERAGVEVRDALAAFSSAANRSTGDSHPMDAERFDDFVIESARLGPDRRPGAGTISEWLVADGWSAEVAWDLALKYERGLRLLDRKSRRG